MSSQFELNWIGHTRSDLKPFQTADTALLATSVGRSKLQSLKQDGYRVCGLAIQHGNKYGIVTDFGRVVWLSSNAALRGDSGLIAGVPLESTVMQQEVAK